MRGWVQAALLAATVLPAGAAPAPVTLLPPDAPSLTRHLEPQRPTLFLFLRRGDRKQQDLLAALCREAGEKAAVRVAYVRSGSEPLARRYQVTAFPTGIVYDRRGRVVARSGEMPVLAAAVQKAATVMRIDWAEEGDPRLDEVIRIRGGVRPEGKRVVPGIMRTMSLKPEYMEFVHKLAQKAHFADGFIDRRTKEMIATYVSALNKCKY
jgi:hypothetical protein